jgi:hypothetical protein
MWREFHLDFFSPHTNATAHLISPIFHSYLRVLFEILGGRGDGEEGGEGCSARSCNGVGGKE